MAPKRKRESSSVPPVFTSYQCTNSAENAFSTNEHQVAKLPTSAFPVATGAKNTHVKNVVVKLAKSSRQRSTAAKLPPGPIFEQRMRPAPLTEPGFKIMSWNVAGLRALLKEEKNVNLREILDAHEVDVLCLQEIKLQEGPQCEEVWKKMQLTGWHVTWNCSKAKKGYSGTAVISKEKPLSISCGIGLVEHDDEGRVVTAEFSDFFVVNAYVPNSGDGLKRLDYRINKWDRDLSSYLAQLCESKGVILAGDLNCAHEDIDIHNPKGNVRSAGFTQEERESFTSQLLSKGFVDAFRRQYPGVVGYTYWGYRFNMRAKNAGWRLDYFLVSEATWNKVYECYHLPEVLGSDHCPLMLVLKL